MSEPLVTCVCPTTERRRKFLRLAIDCFLAQTYGARELLLVVEGGYNPARPVDPRIRVIEAPGGITLGAKRNFACERSAELIAHLDDDDYSAPGRLDDQVARLLEAEKAVTGYARIAFTDGARWWRYRDPEYPLGTSLLFRRAWWEQNRFRNMAVGSDTPFIQYAQRCGQVAVAPCGDRMVARIHPDSTNKRSMQGSEWECCEPVVIQEVACCA